MSASNRTVEQVLQVVQKHVSPETARRIIKDLLDVPGNASFRDTIERMAISMEVPVNARRL